MARASEKVISDRILGEIVFRKKVGCRRISIRVHPVKGIAVSVPYMVPYAAAEAFFLLKRPRIIEIVSRQKEKYSDMPQPAPELISELRARAKAELPGRLEELASRYGFTYSRLAIKHNATNWGSCSTKSNINLNLNIVRLPKVLQDYVLIHELCHLRHPDHGHSFHLLLEHLLTDNIMKLLSDETLTPEDMSLTKELARKAAASRARYPLDYTITRAIKQYRVV